MKLASEDKTRAALFTIAKEIGCTGELKELLDKYDRLLRNCSNQVEAQHIGALALSEVNRLFQCEWELRTKASIIGWKPLLKKPKTN